MQTLLQHPACGHARSALWLALHVDHRPARPRCVAGRPTRGILLRPSDQPQPPQAPIPGGGRPDAAGQPHQHYSRSVGRSATMGKAACGSREEHSCDEWAGLGQPYPRHVTAQLHRALASTAVVFPDGRDQSLAPNNGRPVPVARRPGTTPSFFPLPSRLVPSEVRDVGPRDDSESRPSKRAPHERTGTLAIGTSRWHWHRRWCWLALVHTADRPASRSRSSSSPSTRLQSGSGAARAGWGCCIARWSDRRPATSAPCHLCARARWLGRREQQLRQQNCRKSSRPRDTKDHHGPGAPPYAPAILWSIPDAAIGPADEVDVRPCLACPPGRRHTHQSPRRPNPRRPSSTTVTVSG